MLRAFDGLPAHKARATDGEGRTVHVKVVVTGESDEICDQASAIYESLVERGERGELEHCVIGMGYISEHGCDFRGVEQFDGVGGFDIGLNEGHLAEYDEWDDEPATTEE